MIECMILLTHRSTLETLVISQDTNHSSIGNIWNMVAVREGRPGLMMMTGEVRWRKLQNRVINSWRRSADLVISLDAHSEPTPGTITLSIKCLVQHMMFPLYRKIFFVEKISKFFRYLERSVQVENLQSFGEHQHCLGRLVQSNYENKKIQFDSIFFSFSYLTFFNI